MLKNYSEEYISEKIAYTKQHTKKEKTGFYPIAYFMSALRDDYKSSEQVVEENKEPVTSNNNHRNEWREKLHALQSDLGHWRRHLEYAEASENPSLAENAKKIILQCEERIQQHLLEQPKDAMASEVG